MGIKPEAEVKLLVRSSKSKKQRRFILLDTCIIDRRANIHEKARRFSGQEASKIIVKTMDTPVNPASNTTMNSSLNATALENWDPSEDMVDMKSPTVIFEMKSNDTEADEEPYKSCSPAESAETTYAIVEGPSASNGIVVETSVDRTETSQCEHSPAKLSSVKSRRGLFPIKSRKVGSMGTSSVSDECFICGKKGGNLIPCAKKYTSAYFCTTKFHQKCIEDYNAAEYSVDCLRKIVGEVICPLHLCSTCYLERWKTTSVQGQLVECVLPVRTKDGYNLKIKQSYTRCHAHCDGKLALLVENQHSHLPYCCECEKRGEEALLRCPQCVRSFHGSCLTLVYREEQRESSNALKSRPFCESCILEDKYGKYFNQAGYVPVKWAGCDNLFQLLPARYVVPMFTGLYELMGKRLREICYRRAWEEMERDLAVLRPSIVYIPEKYTKIKTSVYHPKCPRPRLDGCKESDCMCDCPATDNDRCGPNSECTNRAILQECPEACEAIGGGCNNRGVSRREVNRAVEIREAPGKGMGAFAIQDIPKGSFIAEYAGELISTEEMNRRIAEITAHRNAEEKHYMMALDGQRIIDCKEKGNEGRSDFGFLNHSCSPNCKVEIVHVVVSKKTRPNGVYVKYDKRITIYTTEDVPAGSELCYNYQMRPYNIGCPLPDCKCGAPNCTGTLGSTAGSDNISADVAKQRGNKRIICRRRTGTRSKNALPKVNFNVTKGWRRTRRTREVSPLFDMIVVFSASVMTIPRLALVRLQLSFQMTNSITHCHSAT
ncbi:hypothetical protein KIN20_008237 [Parelaphostrongylus tenuis]|uniref:Histone-lysine N-methyltransferase n=1 Tax=Parelaphostrongylus tenuis TaxID=148309 RepID=A0AAD5M4J4_PARTN|nr:hypothetical protein KIN20_008237 [Parelaphostrongylus tenuis]